MKNLQYMLVLIIVVQSCAVVDGYKDNTHSTYARYLTSAEKKRIDSGEKFEATFNSPEQEGKLIIMKGGPFGKYNFVEVGEWKESVEYIGEGFLSGHAKLETTFDAYGNIIKRTFLDKPKKEKDYYTRELWTSDFEVIDADTVLVQHISAFNKEGNQTLEIHLAVENHKQMLSDRLKSKYKVGTEKIFENGVLHKETTYRYKDRVKKD